jgi:probable HAF family extracellular repeat protein
MLRINGTDLSKRRLIRLLPSLLGGLVLAGAVFAQEQAAATAGALGKPASAAATTYRLINLGAGALESNPVINSSGQVAYSPFDGTSHAFFYDGTRFQDIGNLGSIDTYAFGLNNAGNVVGLSTIGDVFHAYVWSKRSGMIDIGTFVGAGGNSMATGINNRGQVVGESTAADGNTHAFRWSAADGMEDLGLVTPGLINFPPTVAINDAGLVAGSRRTVRNGPLSGYAWTRNTGMIDLGTLGGVASSVVAVDAEGQVAGEAQVAGGAFHAFLWNRATGMKDLGTAGGIGSSALAMSANGHVVGRIDFPGRQHAFSWTRASGMVDLGTLGGRFSRAVAVNTKGQVVGGAVTKRGVNRAFVWTAKQGLVDLNTRLRHVPPGLVLDFAMAISDNGSIVAGSNAGLMLLKPDCGCKGLHTAGPIAAPAVAEVNAPFDASVSFAGADVGARYNVIWSWGDGSGDQAGNARASNGAGDASGRHTYTTPGIYTVTANVVDLGGKSAAVSRTIVAYDRSRGGVGGSGWFMSPQQEHKQGRSQDGKAAFSFVSPAIASAKATGAKAQLQFHLETLSFRSDNLRPVAMQGTHARFEGSGTLNGTGGYKFSLATTAGAGAGEGVPGRFGLRIWHTDPVTKAEVVDYDNQGTAGGTVVEGRIVQ